MAISITLSHNLSANRLRFTVKFQVSADIRSQIGPLSPKQGERLTISVLEQHAAIVSAS